VIYDIHGYARNIHGHTRTINGHTHNIHEAYTRYTQGYNDRFEDIRNTRVIPGDIRYSLGIHAINKRDTCNTHGGFTQYTHEGFTQYTRGIDGGYTVCKGDIRYTRGIHGGYTICKGDIRYTRGVAGDIGYTLVIHAI
jgi:hypothetical protein